jgi:hypothetical protein
VKESVFKKLKNIKENLFLKKKIKNEKISNSL